MSHSFEVSRQITSRAKGATHALVLQEFKVGVTDWQNELLMFVKPEVFLVNDQDKVTAALDMVLGKVSEFNAHIDGIALVSGPLLEQHEIMNRHYGYINLLSRQASEMVSPAECQQIAEALGLVSLEGYPVFGGHEYLKANPDLNVLELDQLWFTKKSIKLRSGFYFQNYERNGQKFVLINGFHPAQLAHFTETDRRIALILLHSNTAWADLRNTMVGATFPEKAVPTSIRGTLYANPAQYGFETVSIANNGVHLSAGPFEAAFEVMNFLGRLMNLDPKVTPPLSIKKMQLRGASLDQALKMLDNPKMQLGDKQTDLFSATEDKNTDDAVNLALSL